MSRYIDADVLKQQIDSCEICGICPDKSHGCQYNCDFPDYLTPKWEILIDAQPSIDIKEEALDGYRKYQSITGAEGDIEE